MPDQEHIKELSIAPADTDQGSNVYVVSYLTRKHGPNKHDVFFDYGPNMQASSKDLKDGSHSGVGDNMKWSEIFWKFSIEGTTYLFRAPMNSPKMGLANSGTLVTPPSPSVTKLPDGSVLSVEDLKGFKSYPFQEMGTLRDAKELARDGQIVFVDSSDNNGQDRMAEEILSKLRASDNVKNAFGAYGPEFATQKSLMFAGPGNSILKWPDGTPDTATSKRVSELLKVQDTTEVPEEDSKFHPIDKKDDNSRFASGIDVDTSKAQESVDKLNQSLSTVKSTARSIGLLEASEVKAKVVASFTAKKASLLSNP